MTRSSLVVSVVLGLAVNAGGSADHTEARMREFGLVGRTSAPSTSAAYDDAKKVASAFQKSAQSGAVCRVKKETATIACAVNASDADADKLAHGFVRTVKAQGIRLTGWKVTLVTPNDYVVSQRF